MHEFELKNPVNRNHQGKFRDGAHIAEDAIGDGPPIKGIDVAITTEDIAEANQLAALYARYLLGQHELGVAGPVTAARVNAFANELMEGKAGLNVQDCENIFAAIDAQIAQDFQNIQSQPKVPAAPSR